MTTARSLRLDGLRRKSRTQVLIVGGGINGISAFRELALNGVDVVLVERGDFMSGASSAPSRMIHGGLRYMENGEFALVKESLRERNLLLANAPHLVSPLPTLIPIASRLAGIWSAALRFCGINVAPGDRGALIVKLGLTLYDLYAGRNSGLPRHRFFGRGEARRRWPDLPPDMVAAALYYDAKISHPERLGVEMVIETVGSKNALALNHVELVSLDGQGVVLRDTLDGAIIKLDPDIIVNATGAWIDLTNGVIAARPPTLIGGTKGSHIVLDNARLRAAVGDEMIYFSNREGRVCILFQLHGHVLAGSTDIRVQDPNSIRCEPQEVDYILASVREVFPDIAVTPDDIIYRFAGVRPLPSSDGRVNANISRDHSCEWLDHSAQGTRPVLNLVGGKWTTFRAFGEQAADKVLEHMGRARTTHTTTRQIGGGIDYPAREDRQAWLAARLGELDTTYAALLLERYGTRAADLASRLRPPKQLRMLPNHTVEEIEWIVETECVVTLADLVLRRLTLGFTGELSLGAIEELSEIAAGKLSWTAPERRSQVSALLEQLNNFNGLSEADLQIRSFEENDVRRSQSSHESTLHRRQMS